MAGRLSKVVVMITGGASGLGLATVQHFAKQGSKVLLCDMASSSGAKVAESYEKNQVVFSPCDVTSESDVNNSLNVAKNKIGNVNMLVNCAGVGVAFRSYNFNKKRVHLLEDFQRVINVNLCGTFNAIRLTCAAFADNQPDENGQRGVIVNTASIAAYDGQIGQVAYAASKGGIVSMTLPLARDLGSMGVRVCTIAPGIFETPMLGTLPPKVRLFLAETVPFPQRLGQPDDFAKLVQHVWENPMLNGETIRLDGALRLMP